MQEEIDHDCLKTQRKCVDLPVGSEEGQSRSATQAPNALLAAINEHDRRRRDFHGEEKSLTLRMRAICRRLVGDTLRSRGVNLSDGSGLKLVREGGSELFETVETAWRARLAFCKRKGEPFSALDVRIKIEEQPDAAEACDLVAHFMAARDTMEAERVRHEKELRRLARELPVWPWAEAIRGFSDLSLAQLVSEAVDPGQYATVAKLWKRMGLAVIHGERQHRTRDAKKAAEMGYRPSRRAVVWNVGECLVKQNHGEYRALYDARKVYEREQAAARGLKVVAAAKIPKKDAAAYMSDGHVHNRAKRVMEKRLIRDLWIEWRRCQRQVDTQVWHAPPPSI